MKHNYKITGFCYRLRPVEMEDAQFIVDTRLEDIQKSQFVHKVSPDVNIQKNWLKNFFERSGDYYFVIENLFTGEKEGLISIYNVNGNKAEWGRWVLKRGSLSSIEGVNLLYKIAFEKLCLEELYTRTVENNSVVVNFHNSINAKFRRILENEFDLEGTLYNAVEQFVDKDYYYSDVKPQLDIKCRKLFERNIRNYTGKFNFHHFGVSTTNLEDAFHEYKGTYNKGDYFEDELQGVKGLFICADQKPTLELLENLENSNTLNYYIKNNIKIYHSGYFVEDIQKAYDFFVNKLGAKIISDMKISTYFKGKICFLMLKNKEMIELIEKI